VNAMELIAMKLAQPRWAVDDLIPEGLTVLAGRPKLGKSWLMLGVAIAVAAGRRALGQIDVTQGDVY
jgi:RecA-family ATPase